MFNVHFPVITNCVMFVYLDVFLELDFVLMSIKNVSHFFELLLFTIMIVFTRSLKGYLENSTSTLYKNHYPESHY